MFENLEFEYVGNDLTATIDNETLPINKDTSSEGIFKIIKYHTQFFNNSNLNTILNAPINVDLFLGYIDEDEEIEAIDTGVVSLTLTSITGQTIYDQKNITFKNGIIQTQFANTLSIGKYLLQAEYLGNRYLENTSITIQFNIEKRIIKCTIDNDIPQGYPQETISIGVTLTDYLNDKKINDCIINYSFNSFKYITKTNEQGYALLTFSMPKVDSSVCPKALDPNYVEEEYVITQDDDVFYFDDNGMIKYSNPNRTEFNIDYNGDYVPVFNKEDIPKGYENEDVVQTYTLVPRYPLEISIDSDIYQLQIEQSVNVLLKQYSTEIVYNTTINNSTINIEGDVIGKDVNNKLANVEYGIVALNITEINPHPYKQATVDENGHFKFSAEIKQTENANKQPLPTKLYSTTLETYTDLSIIGDTTVSRSYAKKHKIGFKANVKTVATNHIVACGMITFIIMKNYDEVYRYITELNKNGEAYFYFDVSTIGDYQVKAEYYSIFEYLSSESDIETYKIVEDS